MKRVLFLNGIDRKTNCGYYTQTFFVGDLSSKFSSKTARRFLCYGTTVPKQTHYFNNQVIAPTSTYEYDALYRLTKATGRELSALTAPTHDDFANDIFCPDPAANAMKTYIHNYQYDKLGNMLSDHWKTYQYAVGNNYLLGNDNIANQFTYDVHGNMLTMPHLTNMLWNYKDELISASNGTFISYYNYDTQGNRTRKVVVKNNVVETRYYINGYEVFRKKTNGTLDFERTTLNIADDEKVFVRIEQKIGESEVVRYQYDNHLGSACLELDDVGAIISYEEYHAFGTTSYKSGRSEVEVSQKRYKYNGKERDEETGLYAYGMRYYAAWICRFVSVDPLQFDYPELTPFQYASNRPVSGVDLDGLEYVSVTNSKINLDDCRNDNGTYSFSLGDKEYENLSTIDYNDEQYFNLGEHMYNNNGEWSSTGEEADKMTEWIYTDIQNFNPDNMHTYVWQDPKLTGSDNDGNPFNTNCFQLSNAQAKAVGTTVLQGDKNTIFTYNAIGGTLLNNSGSIDYINQQLEAGNAVVVGLNVDDPTGSNNRHVGDFGYKVGTDHFITITGRTSENGEGRFLFVENAVVNANEARDFNTNRLTPSSTGIKGSSPHAYHKQSIITRVQKNK